MNPGRSLTLLIFLGTSGTTAAHDLDEHWSVVGVLAAALQCQDVSGASDADSCRGAAPVQPEFSFRPDEANEFAIKLGFAAGNALGPVSPFSVPVWAADLYCAAGRDKVLPAVEEYLQANGVSKVSAGLIKLGSGTGTGTKTGTGTGTGTGTSASAGERTSSGGGAVQPQPAQTSVETVGFTRVRCGR